MSQPTPSLLRNINRAAILTMIRERGPIARSQIARDLKISIPTVMRAVEELIADDLILLLDKYEYTGGRPRPLLAYNADAYAIIGIDLGGIDMSGVLTDLAGVVKEEVCLPRNGNASEENIEKLCSIITMLDSTARASGKKVRGVGIGIPGVTQFSTGIVTWAPSLDWRDLPLRAMLEEKFNLPIFLENDVNLAALGEWGFGAGKGTRNMVLMTVGTGIGAGLILDGILYRGHHSASGEIGYLIPGIDYLRRSYAEYGALEGLASELGMLRRARTLFEQQEGSGRAPEFTSGDVFKAAREGKQWAVQTVSEMTDYLSLAIAALNSILDPELIVFGGGMVLNAKEEFLNQILCCVQDAVPYAPRLVVSSLGPHAVAYGTIMMITNGIEQGGLVSSMANIFYASRHSK